MDNQEIRNFCRKRSHTIDYAGNKEMKSMFKVIEGIGTAISSIASILLLIFLVMKLDGQIDWPWLWVLSPIWIPAILAGVLLLFAFLIILVNLVVNPRKGASKHKWRAGDSFRIVRTGNVEVIKEIRGRVAIIDKGTSNVTHGYAIEWLDEQVDLGNIIRVALL